MADEAIAQFIAFTDASETKAASYLKVSDGNFEQAVSLYFEMGGIEMEPPAPTTSAPTGPAPPPRSASNEPINLDDDADMEDADLREAMRASGGSDAGPVDADEEMARRLQEEFYKQGGAEGEGVRAPIAKKHDTLVGGMDDDDYDMPMQIPAAMRRAMAEQANRGNIFQQRTGVWDEDAAADPTRRGELLSRATGGASETSSRATRLAELFRPPHEILSHFSSIEEARDEAKEVQKWLLINVQENSVFECQLLNRDLWKAPEVQNTVKENFIFMQWERDGHGAREYMRLYLPQAADPNVVYNPDLLASLFPHIAIIDPRTGEQVKVWKSVPKTPMEFVSELHEFLERYSLDLAVKNPVQRQAAPKKVDVDRLTEEEMLQMAMQNSLGGDSSVSTPPGSGHDPDELTKAVANENESKGKEVEPKKELTPFQKIAADRHHEEPPPGPTVTRIQFKLHDGSRVVRRFAVDAEVERVFEYVKADLLPDKDLQGKDFELVAMGGNGKLLDKLKETVESAGLKMATVMVEVDGE